MRWQGRERSENVEDRRGIPTAGLVIGGGSLIDRAKLWRFENAPGAELIAVPSIWGSGAEVSPVAVLDDGLDKKIRVDPTLVPDKACFWPELAQSIPENLARDACGDAWSHAMEGFLSPMATDQLRGDLATVIRQLIALPIGNDPLWFEASAKACSGQAQSSVGLVHGIAHTLEGILRSKFPGDNWGHARLCATFLLPVMEFNRQSAEKWNLLASEFDLDESTIFSKLKQLSDQEAYNQALPYLDEYWMDIVKDPCSRTNSSLVRPGSKAFFLEWPVK